MNAIEAKTRLYRMFRRWPPQAVLLVAFASFYFAIGPGNYFGVDEAMEGETAQALILRRTLDIPAMPDARFGREQSFYTLKSAGLAFAALPFIYAGLKLDDAFGSMNGGELAGLRSGQRRIRCAGAGGWQSRPHCLVMRWWTAQSSPSCS